MKIYVPFLSIALILALSPFPCSLSAGELPDMVRELNAAQNRIVRGDQSARAAAAKQFERIELALPAIAPEDWARAPSVRAAAIYLLCGGSPLAMRKLFESHVFQDGSVILIAASLAHAEGQSRDAAILLQPLEAKSFPPVLGGHLALVQGGLTIGVDNSKASGLFDLARLLMPGSLVEEAALRREVAILDASRYPDKLLLLGQRYVAQYSSSPFAKNFWDEFSAAIVKIALNIDDARLTKLQGVFKNSSSSSKLDVALAIARKAILNAQISIAAAQTTKAESFADTASDRNRLKLYNSLIMTVSGGFEEGLSELQQINQNALSRADSEVLKTVLGAVMRLHLSPKESDLVLAHVPSLPKQDSEDAAAEGSPIVNAAQQALAETGALLKKAARQ